MANSKKASTQDAPSESGAQAERTDVHTHGCGASRPRPTCSDITFGGNPGLWLIPDWAVHELGDVPAWFEPDHHRLPDWFLLERPEVRAILPDLQLMQLLMRVPALRHIWREVRVAPAGMEDMLAALLPPGAVAHCPSMPPTEMRQMSISHELPYDCFGAGLGRLGYGFRTVARVVSNSDGSKELNSFELTIRDREPDSPEWDAPGEKQKLYALWHLELLQRLFYIGTPPVYAPTPETTTQEEARLAVDILQLVVYGFTSRRQDFEKLLQQVKDKHAYHQQKAAS